MSVCIRNKAHQLYVYDCDLPKEQKWYTNNHNPCYPFAFYYISSFIFDISFDIIFVLRFYFLHKNADEIQIFDRLLTKLQWNSWVLLLKCGCQIHMIFIHWTISNNQITLFTVRICSDCNIPKCKILAFHCQVTFLLHIKIEQIFSSNRKYWNFFLSSEHAYFYWLEL